MSIEEQLTRIANALEKYVSGINTSQVVTTGGKVGTKRRRTKSEIEADKAATKLIEATDVTEQSSDPQVSLGALENAGKALVNKDPDGSKGFDKAKSIMKEYGYTELSKIEPQHFKEITDKFNLEIANWKNTL